MPRLVELHWSYPKTWDSALASIEAQGNGVYQISRVFGGVERLLYIGIVASANRCFEQRMHEHRKEWLFAKRGAMQLRFGAVLPLEQLRLSRQLIEEVEGALVFQMEPPENTSKISSYTIRRDFVLFNTGNRGTLPKEIDTSNHPWK